MDSSERIPKLEEAPAKFQARETVNGTKIRVAWDETFRRYAVFVSPAKNLGANEGTVNDEHGIGISSEREDAEAVYEMAVKAAGSGKDFDDIYRKIDKHVRTFYPG